MTKVTLSSVGSLVDSTTAQTDGTTTNNRMYINTDGSASWTAVITAT